MREMRVIFGWLLQIIGILTFFVIPWVIPLELWNWVLHKVGNSPQPSILHFTWESYLPLLLVIVFAVLLTWSGLRLRRN